METEWRRHADGTLIIEYGGGCRPASDIEVELVSEIERVRGVLQMIANGHGCPITLAEDTLKPTN